MEDTEYHLSTNHTYLLVGRRFETLVCEKAERLRQVLDHTMHLVSVIILALKRAASQSRSGFYLDEMVAYLSDLQNIHPDASFRPYHHLSMHLPHFFDLFGPARCFWTYPFERLIYQIQRLLSNHKLG